MNDIRFLHGRTSGPQDWELDDVSMPVEAQQRVRILDATTHVLYRHGYADMTVAHVVREARVSRRTFYEHFENKEHVYLAAFGAALECIAAAIRERYVGDTWAEKVGGAFGELRRLLLEYPQAAHTCLMEVGAAGDDGASRRVAALGLCRDGLAVMVDDDFGRPGHTDPLALEFAVGGVVAVLITRLRVEDAEGAADALPALVHNMLAPLVGEAPAADAVAHMPARPGTADRSQSDTG